MKLRTWAGSTVDTKEGWRRVVLTVVGHTRVAIEKMFEDEPSVRKLLEYMLNELADIIGTGGGN
jgi:hypothetical protein